MKDGVEAVVVHIVIVVRWYGGIVYARDSSGEGNGKRRKRVSRSEEEDEDEGKKILLVGSRVDGGDSQHGGLATHKEGWKHSEL